MGQIKKYGIYLLLIVGMFLCIPISDYLVLHVYQSEVQRRVEEIEPLQADEVKSARVAVMEMEVLRKSIRKLFKFSAGIQDYDFPEGTLDIVFTPFHSLEECPTYAIREMGRMFSVEFYTKCMQDGIYAIDGYLHNNLGKIVKYPFDLYVEVEDGVMRSYRGKEVNLDLSIAVQNKTAFALFSAEYINAYFVMNSISGIEGECADSQVVYYQLEDAEGNQRIFEPVQQIRPDYAKSRRSDLYLGSGSRIYLGKQDLSDGTYKVKLFIEKDKLYEAPFSWDMEISHGTVTVESNEYLRGEIEYDLSNAVKDEAVFGSFSASYNNSGQRLTMYSVAGINEESADSQQVYYQLTGPDGTQHIYEPAQQDRPDYADTRGSDLYVKSGNRVDIPAGTLPDGVYEIKIFIQKDKLYEVPGIWLIEITNGKVTVERSDYLRSETEYDLSDAEKSAAAFGSFSAEYSDSGNRLIMYSVAGINEESADSQQVYYQLTGPDGAQRVYEPVQQDRPDYAEMRGSPLYMKSGNKVELVAGALGDGKYTVKIFIQKEQLYEVPETWTMELSDGIAVID